MARYKKKDYLTTIKLLKEINWKLQERGWNQPDVTVTLADCQEAAIALGSNLERQGEIGIQLTHILEEYCENLYQLGEQLDGGKQFGRRQDFFILFRELAQVEVAIGGDKVFNRIATRFLVTISNNNLFTVVPPLTDWVAMFRLQNIQDLLSIPV